MRTPITYYGGKQRLAAELLKLIPEHRLYVEPFMGGGALFFAKPPSEAEIINDKNGNVTNFYRVAQSQFEELKKLIDETLHSRATYKEAMKIYNTSANDNLEGERALCAWAFWVVTNQGFSGKVGSWAVAKKDNKIGKTLANKREGFTKEYAQRLKHVQIESKDALEIIKQYDSEDTFFYLDPPYFNSDCGHYKGYSKSEFIKLLELLTNIKGKFLLSNYPSEVLREYIDKQGWSFREKEQKINVTHQTKKSKVEVMVYNYPPPPIEQALKEERPSLPPVQKRNGRSKLIAHKKVASPLKNSAPGSLEVEEEVRCFADREGKEGGLTVVSKNPLPFRSMKNSVKQLRELAKSVTLHKTASPKRETAGRRNRRNSPEQSGDAEENGSAAIYNTFEISPAAEPESINGLQVIHSSKLLMQGEQNDYFVLGEVSQDMGSMLVTLMAEEKETGRKERLKTDLYEKEQVKYAAAQMAQTFGQHEEHIEYELSQLTDLLEQYREKQLEQVQRAEPYYYKRNQAVISAEMQKRCMKLLTGNHLISKIDKLIEQAGVVGEENSRILLYIIASTYKMQNPLQALVQGESGSGKSHLINVIGNCMPPEDVMNMTRVTSKSFYHYNKDELVNKLLLIQDYDGMDVEAQYAFRELQSAGSISSSTTYKDRNGNLVSTMKLVRSHFASLLATSQAEAHYGNMSRSIVIGIDESESQTDRIIQYQNQKLAGVIGEKEEKEAREFLQSIVRCIKPMHVINPYADKIILPTEAKTLRRLNTHYQSFVRQITLLHQYQRKRDRQGRLITEPEDLRIACDILFDAIMMKVDDLDASLRHFFDRLKEYLKKQRQVRMGDKSTSGTYEAGFTQRDVRLALNVSKTQCFRYMEELERLEYIQRIGGYANRGFKYRIVYSDDMEKTRKQIKEELDKQLNELGNVKRAI